MTIEKKIYFQILLPALLLGCLFTPQEGKRKASPGLFSVCVDSLCDALLNQGYLLGETSLSLVGLTGWESSSYRLDTCGPCFSRTIDTLTYLLKESHVVSRNPFSIKIINNELLSGEYKFSGTDSLLKVDIELRNLGNSSDTQYVQYWHKFRGTVFRGVH